MAENNRRLTEVNTYTRQMIPATGDLMMTTTPTSSPSMTTSSPILQGVHLAQSSSANEYDSSGVVALRKDYRRCVATTTTTVCCVTVMMMVAVEAAILFPGH